MNGRRGGEGREIQRLRGYIFKGALDQTSQECYPSHERVDALDKKVEAY